MKNKYPLIRYCTLCLKYRNEKVEAALCAITPQQGICGVRDDEKYPRGYCLECAIAEDKRKDDLLNGILKTLTEVHEKQIAYYKEWCKNNDVDFYEHFPQYKQEQTNNVSNNA